MENELNFMSFEDLLNAIVVRAIDDIVDFNIRKSTGMRIKQEHITDYENACRFLQDKSKVGRYTSIDNGYLLACAEEKTKMILGGNSYHGKKL